MAGSHSDKHVPSVASTQAAVVIIGAGFGGLCAALDLIRHNKCRDFIILEQSAGVGGVWRDNNYPGCAVDVSSIVYSYSFAQNSEWARELPEQAEILAYLTSLAQKHNLYQHIRFGSTVTEASWNDKLQRWETRVKLAPGSKEAEVHSEYTIASDFVVSAVGQLSQPQYPSIPGLDDFGGKLMHSSRWDWSYDLRGKSVAVIGTGCSAVQLVPEVARVAKQVTVFQRQPHWIVPRGDFAISESTRRLYRYFPSVQHSRRRQYMGLNEAGHRSQAFDGNEENLELKQMALDMMREQLPNRPDLWEKLTPSYPVGCKRLVATDFFLPALGRDNVKLETRPIRRFAGQAISIGEGEGREVDLGEFDVVICATGFRTKEFLHPLKISGRNGRDLNQVWKDGAYAYLGTCVPDMPNFGVILGPNTGLLHNSFVLMIESQSRYINGLIKPVLEARRRGHSLSFSPRADVTAEYNEWLQNELQSFAVADAGCTNWYRTASGKITNLWPGLVIDYQKRLQDVKYQDFDVRGSSDQPAQPSSRVCHVGRAVEEPGLLDTLSPSTVLAIVGVGSAALFAMAKLFIRPAVLPLLR